MQWRAYMFSTHNRPWCFAPAGTEDEAIAPLLNAAQRPSAVISMEQDNPSSSADMQPGPFPKFAEFGGHHISTYMVDSIAYSFAETNEPYFDAQMTALGGEVLCADQTFEICKKVLATDSATALRFRPFEGFASIMNEYGQVIWYAFVFTKESMRELKPALQILKQRLDKLGLKPKVGYVDNCCTVRSAYKEVFGDAFRVLLDPFHWLARWLGCIAVPEGHQLYFSFRAMMSQALMCIDQDDFDAESKKLREAGKPVSYKAVAPSCRNYILPPEKLLPRVNAVITYWTARDERITARTAEIDTKRQLGSATAEQLEEDLGELFFKPFKFTSVYLSQISHICPKTVERKGRSTVRNATHTMCGPDCTGCLSDPQGINLNVKKPSHKDYISGKQKNPTRKGYFTKRGSSQQENMHSKLRKAVGWFAQGARKVSAKVKNFLFRWNQKAGVEKRGETDYGTYQTQALALINSYAAEAGGDLPFPDLKVATAQNVKESLGMSFNSPSFQRTPPVKGEQSSLPPPPIGGSNLGAGIAARVGAGAVVAGSLGQLAAFVVGGGAMLKLLYEAGYCSIKVLGDMRCGFRALVATNEALLKKYDLTRREVCNSGNAKVIEALYKYRQSVALFGKQLFESSDLSQMEMSMMIQSADPRYMVNGVQGDIDLKATFGNWYNDFYTKDDRPGTEVSITQADYLFLMLHARKYHTKLELTTFREVGNQLEPKIVLHDPVDASCSVHILYEENSGHADPAFDHANHFSLLVEKGAVPFNARLEFDIDALAAQQKPSVKPIIVPWSGFGDKNLSRSITSLAYLSDRSGIKTDLYAAPLPDPPEGQDERDFFAMHHEGFNPDASATNPKSYHKFALFWNAAAYANARLRQGGDDALALRLKTKKHLTDYRKKLGETMASDSAGKAEGQLRAATFRALKSSRPRDQPEAENPSKVVYSVGNGFAPPRIASFPSLPGIAIAGATPPVRPASEPSSSAPYRSSVTKLAPLPETVSGYRQCSSCGALYTVVKHKKSEKGPSCTQKNCKCGKPKVDHPNWMKAGPLCTGNFEKCPRCGIDTSAHPPGKAGWTCDGRWMSISGAKVPL